MLARDVGWRMSYRGRRFLAFASQHRGTGAAGSRNNFPGDIFIDPGADVGVVDVDPDAVAVVKIRSKIRSNSWRADWTTFCLVLLPR